MLRRITEIADEAVKALPHESEKIARDRISRIRNRIRLGIITALPKEAAAIIAVLGGEVVELPLIRRAHVSYYLSEFASSRSSERIEVVVALANHMGNNAAAVTAATLLSDFRSIEELIVTGIAGGIPAPQDPTRHVRLGDVVVGLDGILQYDFLKRELGKSELRRMAVQPSSRLVSAIRQIQMAECSGTSEWQPHLAPFHHKRPSADVLHSLDTNDKSKTVTIPHPDQPGREFGQPLVHYGMIGSANILLKDSAERDRLSLAYKLQAVEMEGSGIADASWNFAAGYIAVRSICDYCDMSKNDDWQEYAAYAAAAYTRAIVERALGTQAVIFR